MVKRSAGGWIQGGGLVGDEQLSWRRRIGLRLIDAMRSGQLPPGARLPSARQLARDWGLSRGTVDEAFAQLQADGLIERRIGSGSFVVERPRLPPLADAAAPGREPNLATRRAIERLQTITDDPSDLPLHGQQGLRLRPQIMDVSQFPLALWRRLLSQAHSEANRSRLSWGAAAGTRELRQAVARHLALSRGVACNERQVIIVSGPLHAMTLIVQVLLEPGSIVGLLDPSHVSMPRFFNLMHLDVCPLPQDAHGLNVEAAERICPKPAAVMLAPAAQYPLGGRLPPERRRALLDWADRSGAWILELEYLAEVTFDGRPAPAALWAEDRRESALLFGGFGALVYPTLRMGYLVVPERLAPAFTAVRGLFGDHCNTLLQLALARFMSEDYLATYLRRLAVVYQTRREAMLAALGGWPLLARGCQPAACGVNLCVKLPASVPDQTVAAQLAALRVGPGTLSSHSMGTTRHNGLILGFGADEPAEIGDAVGHIGSVVQAMSRPSSRRG